MSDEEIILWKYCLTDDLPTDYVPGDRIDSENDHELVHGDLKILIEFLYLDTRGWSLAKVVADEKDVKPIPGAPDGWFRTLCHIPSEEGFFPQHEAEKKYEDYL